MTVRRDERSTDARSGRESEGLNEKGKQTMSVNVHGTAVVVASGILTLILTVQAGAAGWTNFAYSGNGGVASIGGEPVRAPPRKPMTAGSGGRRTRPNGEATSSAAGGK